MVVHGLSKLKLEELRDLAIRADIRIPTSFEDIDTHIDPALDQEAQEREFLIEQLEEWFYDESGADTDSNKTHMHVLRAKFDFFRDKIHHYHTPITEELDRLEMMAPKSVIRFMMRDPSWAYVYWDLSLREKKVVNSARELVLRLFDLKQPILQAEHVIAQSDISVGVSGDSQYINLPKESCWYAVKLIALMQDGSEKTLATSQCIKSIERFLLERVDQLLTQPCALDIALSGVVSGSQMIGDNVLIDELITEIKQRGGKWHE